MATELFIEMIIEIMSRGSLKTFSIMRCVCKEFNTLANEPYVFDQLKKNNKIVSGYLIQNMRGGLRYIKGFAPSPGSSSLDLGFLPYNSTILATSEQLGIMVFHSHDPTNYRKELYHVCKPTTRQVLALPNPKLNETVGKFAIVVMDSKPLHYKIIRFSNHSCGIKRYWRKFYSTYSCEIFDSLTWEWRSLKHIKLPADHHVFLTDSQPVALSGSIYMLLSNYDILKFDAYTENWNVFSSPIPYDESGYSSVSIKLVKYGKRLGLVSCESRNLYVDGRWDIWVLKMNGLWEKEDVAVESKGKGIVKDLYDLDTSVVVNYKGLMFYKFRHGNNMISEVVLHAYFDPVEMFPFLSDFEPVDLVRPPHEYMQNHSLDLKIDVKFLKSFVLDSDS